MPRSHRSGRSILRATILSLEALEGRSLMSVLPAMAHHAAVHHPATHPVHAQVAAHATTAMKGHHAHPGPAAPAGVAHPMLRSKAGDFGSTTPSAGSLTPAQIRHIYAFDQVTNLGAGQTIAIVDAYDAKSIFADADTFDKQFTTTLGGSTSYYSAYGASSTWLSEAYVNNVKPSGNASWGQEISLDVEWAHAIAPQAKIILVEAASASYADLLAADKLAVANGASVISNSWGGSESSAEAANYDSTFQGPGSKTFVFSSGDSGVQSYPSESPYVVSTGGTTLSHDGSFNWSAETSWTSGGGGLSAYEATPSYQGGLFLAHRGNPDIAYDSDPNTGFAVYDSTAYHGSSGWLQFGGTSDAAPQVSALIAIANSERVTLHSKPVLDGYLQTLPAIYALTASSDPTTNTVPLYDVTTGGNSVASAGPGYDLVTGKGTPRRADLVIAALVAY